MFIIMKSTAVAMVSKKQVPKDPLKKLKLNKK